MKSLTPRQLDVLRVSAQGLHALEGAALLGITSDTFRQHRSAALRRLGAHTTTEAVAIAMRKGLVK